MRIKAALNGATVGLVLIGALALGGCQKRSTVPFPTEAQLNSVTHTVAAGETLFAISAWYTGQGQNWKGIVDANPGLNPNKMRVGEVIKIPRRLVARVDRMPIGGSAAAGKRSAGAPTKASGESKSEQRNADVKGAGSAKDAGTAVTKSAGSPKINQVGEDSKVPGNDAFDDDFLDPAPSGSAGGGSAGDSAKDAVKDALSADDAPARVPALAVPLSGGSASSVQASAVSSAVSRTVSSAASAEAAASAVIKDVGEAPVVAPSPAVEKRAKSRDELLQELLKDY